MPDWGHRIPTILTSQELLDKALRKASKVSVRGASRLDTAKKTSLGRISATSDILNSTLIKYVKRFPSLDREEEFFPQLMDVLIGNDELRKSLGALNWAARKVNELQRTYTRRIKGAHEVDQVVRLRKEFYGRISSVIEQISDHLVFVGRAREEMKRIPSIDPDIPTLVVAGFPNVGKSQLVTRLSNARPTIASYPFTTKGIGVGHLQVRWFTYQVVDTPGLLDRPLEERNEIERQAVLALRYLADVILFVLDPSETSGYTMEHQLSLLSSVESWMEGIPMVVVENKVDLHRSESDRIKVSAFTDEGMEDMMEKVVPYLESGWKDSTVREA